MRRPHTPDPRSSSPSAREEVRDWRGRHYSVGPSARALTGGPRSVILVRALIAAAAVGVLQFGYGAALPSLVAAHDRPPALALLPFLVWTLAQGACAPALHRARARRELRAGTLIPAGALLCAAALVVLGTSSGLTAAVLGYGILGGVGAGLVYHSCTDLVGGWFPDRRTVRSGAVGGAFALGSVPLLPAIAAGIDPSSLPFACAALAALVLVLGIAGGAGQRTAPPRWWPPESDPRAAALLRGADPPPATDFTHAQAWTAGGSLPLLHAIVALSGASGLFTLAVLPLLLLEGGHPPSTAALAVTAFAAASGLGRLAAGAAAERTGRRRALALLLGAGALAQTGLAAAVPTGQGAVVALLAVVAGAGAGSCYPLTRAITEGHFGSRWTPDIHGLVYSSKAVGGLVGVGGAVLLLASAQPTAWPAGLAAAGALCGASSLLAALLRRPLPVRTTPAAHGVWTAPRRRAPM